MSELRNQPTGADDSPGAGAGDGTVQRPPIFVAAVAQAIAALIVFGTAAGVGAAIGNSPPLMVSLGLQGAVAAILGIRFGSAIWWAPIHLILPPAVGLAMMWAVPAWVFGTAFFALLLVYWNTARGVPLYLSNAPTRATLADLLPDRAGIRVIDLGAGFAGPVLALARRRPDAECQAVESAPLVFALAWLRVRFSGLGNIKLRYGDFADIDLAPFDVVYCFLSPVPMPALFDKARAEMRSGTLLISNTFDVPGCKATEIVDIDDRRRTKLHLWRM